MHTRLLLFLLALSLNAGYTPVGQVHPDDSMRVQRFRLNNGLMVYLSENHESPDFFAEIAVRAGSKHDPTDNTGLAHYLEHLLFKGTRKLGSTDYDREKPHLDRIEALYDDHARESDSIKRKAIYAEINATALKAAKFAVPNGLDKLYRGLGGSGLNAHTYLEETVYSVQMPANRIEQWAAIESERFRDPVFRLFHTELETVYEEKNRDLDSENTALREALGAAIFPRHPYGQQTILGSAEHLKRPSLRTIREYFDSYYVANNMAICISGDIDAKKTIALIDRYFSSWRSGKLPELPNWDEPWLTKREAVELVFDAPEALAMAFRLPPANHPDADALVLMDMLLDNSVAGLINLNLNQAQRVEHASSYIEYRMDRGTEVFWATPRDGQTLEQLEALILEQIAMLKRGEFDDWLPEAIIRDFKKEQMEALESNDARVKAMRDAFIHHQSWEHVVTEIPRLQAVSRADVLRVAKRYLAEGYVVAYRREGQQEIPKIDKPVIDPIELDRSRQSDFARQVLAMPSEPREPEFIEAGDYRILPISKGVTLHHADNPMNSLFSLSITVDLGSSHDRRWHIVSSLMGKAGTTDLDPMALKKRWYRLGASFDFGVSANSAHFHLTGLDEQFDAALSLMRSVIARPSLSDEAFASSKSLILKRRRDAQKDPGSLAYALREYQYYGADSRSLKRLSATELQALKLADLLAMPKGLLDYEHHVSYTGPRKPETVAARFANSASSLRKPPAPRLREMRTPQESEIYFLHKDTAQAQIRIGFPVGNFDDAESADAEVFNSYFDGDMSAIVFQELREARGLAYIAGGGYSQGSRVGAQNRGYGYIGCQPDKAPEALGGLIGLIDALPISPKYFSTVKTGLISDYRGLSTSYRDILSSLRYWEHQGLSPDPRRTHFARIQEMTLDDLIAFHKSHMSGRPKLITIVGDRARLDLQALATYGQIRELQPSDIFSN